MHRVLANIRSTESWIFAYSLKCVWEQKIHLNLTLIYCLFQIIQRTLIFECRGVEPNPIFFTIRNMSIELKCMYLNSEQAITV